MPFGDLNWNDLKYFLGLARLGRLSQTARELGSTHVTVANRIARIEEAIGDRLFTQSGDGFRLTREGRHLLPFAEECERQLMLAAKARSAEETRRRPTIRVGLTEGIGHGYFARRFASWICDHYVELELVTLPKLSRITRRDADICVTMEEPEGTNVIKQRLVPYRLGIYAAETYLASAPPLRTREDLLDHVWIGYVDDLIFSSELTYHREISDELNYVLRGTTLLTQLEAVLAGTGLAVLPHYIASGQALRQVLPEVEFERVYWMSSTTDLHRIEGQYAVWRFIKSACAADRRLFLEGKA